MLRLSFVALSTTALVNVAYAEVPRVVTDIAPVHGLVSMVMKDLGTPALMIEPGSSPHANAMRPSVAGALQDAEIVFWIGEDLSPWLNDPIETLGGAAEHVSLLDLEDTRRLGFRETDAFTSTEVADDHDHDDHEDHGHDDGDHAHDEDDHAHDEADAHGHDDHGHDDVKDAHDDHGHEDHADGAHDHDHSGTDPHAWLDPRNAQTWLTQIAAVLSQRDPANADAYAANAAAAVSQIDAAVADAQNKLAGLENRPFIVFHDAYQYFETGFGLKASGALSLSDAVPPSPSHVAEIQTQIREAGIVCVFSEPQYSDGLVRTVIDGTSARAVELDPLGVELEQGATFYPTLIRDMAARFETCLQ